MRRDQVGRYLPLATLAVASLGLIAAVALALWRLTS